MSLQVTAKQSNWPIPKFPSISRAFVTTSAAIFAASMFCLSQFQTAESSFNFMNVSVSVLAGLAGGAFFCREKAVKARPVETAVQNRLVEPAVRASSEEKKTVKARPSLEPTTSGYLRWMNIWLDADRRGLTGAGKTVSIFGPGKWEAENQVHCPQLAEACQMFNGSQITVYDSNTDVLEATAHIDHELSQTFIQEAFKQNKQLAKSANFQQVKDQLSSGANPNCSIVQRDFRMGEDQPDAEGSDDMIIATFSLMYPMRELAKSDKTGQQRIEFLSQYLAQLKPGGAMYVEKDCIAALLGNAEDQQMAMARNPVAQGRLKALIDDKAWKRRVEKALAARGIQVEIHELRQAFGAKEEPGGQKLPCPGVFQANNRLTQTSDVVVFVRK